MTFSSLQTFQLSGDFMDDKTFPYDNQNDNLDCPD
jgi:hypothetical protein